jgi:hypothetical protein
MFCASFYSRQIANASRIKDIGKRILATRGGNPFYQKRIPPTGTSCTYALVRSANANYWVLFIFLTVSWRVWATTTWRCASVTATAIIYYCPSAIDPTPKAIN